MTLEQCWHDVPGGTAVAALELLVALREYHRDVSVRGVSAIHLRRPAEPWRPTVGVDVVFAPPKLIYDMWNRGIGNVGRRADVVHATTLLVPPTSRPLVVTVHDLAVLHEPEHFTPRGVRLFTGGLASIRDRAAVVCCSSLATMQDCRAAGIEADRLRHVPLGVRVRHISAGEVAAMRRSLGIDGPYLFATSTLEPRKNLPALLEAVASDPSLPRLLVAGPKGWGPSIEPLVRTLGDRVRLLGFVDRRTQAQLYAGAAAMCYPSLREGFGLPVVEAMAHGTPVVTSRGTSTEEVAAGAAVLVDPHDVSDIARGIGEALSRSEELSTRGRARAAELTWERTAALTVAAYREALERHR